MLDKESAETLGPSSVTVTAGSVGILAGVAGVTAILGVGIFSIDS